MKYNISWGQIFYNLLWGCATGIIWYVSEINNFIAPRAMLVGSIYFGLIALADRMNNENN